MSRGFIQIRRGLEDHLFSGQIGFFEVGIYLAIHLQADFKTGVWTGSAPRLLAAAPRGTALREVQRALARLEKIGFLRSFHVHGRRGNYRVLINKYEPQFGALRGFRLNAYASTSWNSPTYEPCADIDTETVAETAPYLKEKEKEKAAPDRLPQVTRSSAWQSSKNEERQFDSELRKLLKPESFSKLQLTDPLVTDFLRSHRLSETVQNAFFDSRHLSFADQLTECVHAASGILMSERVAKLRDVDERAISARALDKLQSNGKALEHVSQFKIRSDMTVTVVVRETAQAAADIFREIEGIQAPGA